MDRRDLREAAEHGESTVNWTAESVTGPRYRLLTTLSQGEGASTADNPTTAAWERKERSMYACTC